MRAWLSWSAAILLGAAVLSGEAAAQTAEPASALLSKVDAAYARAKTYRDTGTVTGQRRDTAGRWQDLATLAFRTAFDRVGHFRYEVRQGRAPSTPDAVVYADEAGIVSWMADQDPRREPSLGDAVGRLANSSGGSVQVVPALLATGDAAGFRVTRLEGATRLPDEEIEGVPCAVVRGRDPSSAMTYTLYIDRARNLIQRVKTERPTVKITIDYRPDVDVRLGDGELLVAILTKDK